MARVTARHAAALAAAIGVLLLAACAKPLPPPPPPAVLPLQHAAWSFEARRDACLAIAAAGRDRLAVEVRRSGPIRLSVTLRGEPPRHPVAHFRGPAGAWTIAGGRAGDHEAGFSLGRDVDGLSHVLVLLSGGVVALDGEERPLLRLELPASGPRGQHWFSCVRRSVS